MSEEVEAPAAFAPNVAAAAGRKSIQSIESVD